MHNIFASTPDNYDSIMMWATCSLAFFWFLKCREFTVSYEDNFDPETHLTLQDIPIDNYMNPSTGSSSPKRILSRKVLVYS